MSTSRYSRFEHLSAVWPWLPLWAVVALLAIFSHDPMPLYSTRTLAVAWEMWNQHHWLVPYINGQPYSEKAPLLFWMIHAGWFVFGVNDVWPRVLEVLIGGSQLVLASVLARRLFPLRPWMARAVPWMLLALSYAFLFGLQIMYDVLLATWTLAALVCLAPKVQRAEPRWLLFGLCVGAGLLTKGPVMLLHIVFPWLLGPLWSDWARVHRGRWYGRGALALLLSVGMLLAWALPAGFAGGEAYRQKLFFTQTAGRVVKGLKQAQEMQSHARPLWWYLLALPVLLFPFTGWPRMWVALGALRRPLESGLRFALCWLLPTLIVFSLISGKQLYYPLPELAGVMLLVAGAIAVLRERHPRLAYNDWLGTWPLALASLVFALFLLLLPNLVNSGHLPADWALAAMPYSRYFGVVFLLLGGLLLLRGRGELRRLAVAGLIGTLTLNTLFTLVLWPQYDLAPASKLLHHADQRQQSIAYLGSYDGQFHFAARLTHPIEEIDEGPSLQQYATRHPNGLIVTHPNKLQSADLRYAALVQPFRSSWVVIWSASSLADLRRGVTPPDPAQPTQVYPQNNSQRYSAQP